jgi:hypothetical protein
LIRARLAIAFALAVLAVVAATGCGGGSSDESSKSDTASTDTTSTTKDSPSLPPEVFVAKADAICKEAQKRIETEFASFLKEKGIKEIGEKGESTKEVEAHTLEALEAVGAPQLRRQLEELQALNPPPGAEAKMTAYLEALEEEVEAGEEDPKALNGEASKIFAKSDAAAEGLNFKVCANEGA